jgi:hypothetical protein
VVLNSLPLLDGWATKVYYTEPGGQIVAKGKMISVLDKNMAVGWVIGVDYASSDSQMEFHIDTEYFNAVTTPDGVQSNGAVLPPPSGVYGSLYDRPSPLSTYGTYVGSFITSAYPIPFRGKVKGYVTLGLGSTEPSALAYFSIEVMEVINVESLIKSYRKLLYGRWAGLFALENAFRSLFGKRLSENDLKEVLAY